MSRNLMRPTPPPFHYMNFGTYGKKLKNNWFEVLMIPLILYLLVVKDFSIQFEMGPESGIAYQEEIAPTNPFAGQAVATSLKNTASAGGFHIGQWLDSRKKTTPKAAPTSTSKKPVKVPRAQHFSNLTFIMSPTYAQRKGIPESVVNEKKQHCADYVDKFLDIALREQREHGILASITLAQGLLESNAGDSRLARESLNHFGIKCRRKCRGCTCRNYHDDDIYDMFRVFTSPEESYREHSTLLNGARYRGLKQYGTDYKKWAYGLKKAGYATDKRYAEKLILIIETLKLYQYDAV